MTEIQLNLDLKEYYKFRINNLEAEIVKLKKKLEYSQQSKKRYQRAFYEAKKKGE